MDTNDSAGTEPGAPTPASPEPARPGRKVAFLAALYAASVLAAGVVLWRGPVHKDGGPSLLKGSSLLPSKSEKEMVAIVSISGPIYASDGGGFVARGAQAWGRRLEKLADKSEVKAIVLDINSPGGSVGSIQELYSIIGRVRREHKKPVVAHLGDVAASGGYYLASACDKIISLPGTLLGSIGVIFNTGNIEGLLAKIGVRSGNIKSGKMKDIGSMTRPMTGDEKVLLQALIDNAYGQFLEAVSQGRGIPVAKLRPMADGRIFTGTQGLALGLVDQIGDLQDAIAYAGKLGGIKGKPKVLREGESLSSMLELLDSRASWIKSPEASILGGFGGFSYKGLEYRWDR
ncbi:MAG TPA: signal peptide peptidase SppA [Elusimicrobiota bacterium]|jgi:protease-4|nr:signal peptide peptidase SppA [Elusimicrobiota bacterium]